jgi:hypothetical protein
MTAILREVSQDEKESRSLPVQSGNFPKVVARCCKVRADGRNLEEK